MVAYPDGLPFTGFSPTLGPSANANSTTGTVQIDQFAQATARSVRILRQRSSFAAGKIVAAILATSSEVAEINQHAQVVGKQALYNSYDLGGLVEIGITTQGQIVNDTAIDAFPDLFITWFNTLPTVLPATPGVPWNNGGTVAVS